jgi:RNA polymerase sigma-70 factor (ECF subfamily)
VSRFDPLLLSIFCFALSLFGAGARADTSIGDSAAPDDNTASEAERELVERCRGGDIAAFDDIVARHQTRIFNLCFWMLNDRDEAADAAQDAFVRAYRGLANFRAEAALGTWLHRIAINVCLDTKARRGRTPIPLSTLEKPDEEGESRSIDPADSAPTPPETLLRRERKAAVRAAVAALPEHYRVVILLFDIEGYSYEEAAQALDVPMGTIKSRLNRARAALRVALEAQRELFEA